jgi:hypothetical protein
MFGILHSPPRSFGRGRFDSVDLFDPEAQSYGVYNLTDIEPVIIHIDESGYRYNWFDRVLKKNKKNKLRGDQINYIKW